MQIGTRIRQARQAAGISQARLAQLMGVTRSACSQWESRDAGTAPRLQRLADISRYLGVSYAWLATGQADTRSLHNDRANIEQDGGQSLSWQQQRLLRLYDHMPERARTLLLQLLSSLVKKDVAESVIQKGTDDSVVKKGTD